jgi:hypothetical protein
MLILSFLALIPRLILGFLIIQALWKSTDSEYTLIKLFLAGPLGIGLSSLASFVWMWASLNFGSYVLMETCVVVVWSAFALWKHKDNMLILLKGIISETDKKMYYGETYLPLAY